MKIVEMQLKKGFSKVVPESLDDLWHLYNMIYPGDQVYAQTTREIKIQQEYARKQPSRRVLVFLGLQVEKVYWDKSLNRLRIRGKIVDIPEDIVGKGSYHTLNVVPGQILTILKSQWLKHTIDRLKKASNVQTPLVLLVSIDDEEFAMAVLRQYGLEVKAEKRIKLPGKLEPERRDEMLKAYFKEALTSLRGVLEAVHCPVVILGLGFVKNAFVKHIQDVAPDVAAAVVDVKSVNSSGLIGINESLRSGVLTKTIKHARMVEETRLVEEVLLRLGQGTSDVAYGLDDVSKATRYGAVEQLLLTDVMLRQSLDEERIKLERMMQEVEEKAGKVSIVSTEHEAGTKLKSLGGVAALLRFGIGST